MKLFKELTQDEEREMRQWAHDHYVPYTDIKGIWHPVVQAECIEINRAGKVEGSLWYDTTKEETE